ncbi:Hypothetical protein D9617_28g065260 [Elsinoe fawcettii]|nr:Hypothetical protein D9617_28g065260 [Elsinoe fawcettii]
MSDGWDRPRRREDRREPRSRSVEVDVYERDYERPRRRHYVDDYEDDRRYNNSRAYETALVPVRHRDEDREERYREEKALAVAPYRDARGRHGGLVFYDDQEEYSDQERSHSRRRNGSRRSHHNHKHTGMDKSKSIPSGRCWYSEKERKDADFMEKHFDSSYDGIIAAAAGAAIGAMTANRFTKDEHHKKRTVAASAVAGAVAFNFAENHYRVFVEDEEYFKEKVKTKVKEKAGI